MFQRYAPHLLVGCLADERAASDAFSSLHQAIVVFVDIAESTSITAQFSQQGGDSAERFAGILNRYFGRVIEIAAAHGGDTIRIDGDATVILWTVCEGAAAEPDVALRAASAALALQQEFHEWQPVAGLTVRHRIALVAGRVSLSVVSEACGRRHFVLDGAPIRQLGEPRLRGEPNQIAVGEEVAALLGRNAVLRLNGEGTLTLSSVLAGGGQGSATPRDDSAAEDAVMGQRIQAFVPKVVVDRISEGQADWIAEFRQLTAVYVNLANLDPTAIDCAPRLQQAVRQIETVVRPLQVPITNIVANEKGLIVQIACGLPPFAQEDCPLRAVRAALGIRAALASIGLHCGIGVATGDAFCGEVGSEARREYVSTGLVMAYAARLMQMAGNEILCDEPTAKAARAGAEFSQAEEVAVKGRRDPIGIRRVLAAVPPEKSANGRKGLTFGRSAELELFRARLDGLARGQGGVAAIRAEPGAGKSHLLAHVTRAARERGYTVLTAVTAAVDQSTPYFAFRTLLPQLVFAMDAATSGDIGALSARLEELLEGHALAAKRALLQDIMPLEFAERGLEAEIKGQARVTGIEALLSHLAAQRSAASPMVILVDDVQWLDASSARLLDALVRRTRRLLLVAATRPREDASVYLDDLLAQAAPLIDLPRLGREAIRAIVCERLGRSNVPPQLVDFIHARSEGLPFYAEQLLYSLTDLGVISADGAALRVSDLSQVAVPDSLRNLIVSRVDRLPPSLQLTMKVASVIGRTFDAEMVQEVHPLGSGVSAIGTTLDRLTGGGFLRAIGEAQHRSFEFRHAIIQGVIYDLLPYAQRRQLHRSTALCLETQFAEALAPHYASLAEHWERASVYEKAISYRIDAAETAATRYANEDALRHLDRAQELVDEFDVTLPEAAVLRGTRIRADACQELTRFADANENYRKLAVLQHIRLPAGRGGLVAGIVKEALLQASRRAGLTRSRSHGPEQERDSLAAHLYMRLAEYAYFTNDTLGLAYGTLASLNRAERSGALPEVVNASGGLALGLAAVGLLRWSDYYRRRSIDLAVTAGSPSAQGFAELLACVRAFHIGDWEGMKAHSEHGAAIWRKLGDLYRYHCCLVLDAYRLIAIGAYDEADRALAVFGDHAEAIDSVQVRGWALAASALLDLLLSRPPTKAVEHIAAAMSCGQLHPAELLLCEGIAAAASLRAGDAAGALRSAETGLALIEGGSPSMAGALLFSVPCVGEVFLALAQASLVVERSREDLLIRADKACRAATRFAGRNRICVPRAALLRGHLAAAQGARRRQVQCYRKALSEARSMKLPLEEVMSGLALARLFEGDASGKSERQAATDVLRRLGVRESAVSAFLPEPSPPYAELESSLNNAG